MNFNILSTEIIDANYLKRLIGNKISEGLTLDYKRDLNIGTANEKKEFLSDITSFANAEGGVIIYGVEEEEEEIATTNNTGRPGKIVGIPIESKESLILKIEDIITNGIQPRIQNKRISLIDIDSKTMVVITIPKSYGIPHMVTYEKTNKFYKRRISGKYLLDVFELNQMFMQSNELQERAEAFVTHRIETVLTNNFIPNIITENGAFIHIVPLSFQQNLIGLTGEADYVTIMDLFGHLISLNDQHHNFEGYIMTSLRGGTVYGYFQVFRNGILEYYWTDYIDIIQPDDQKYFFIENLEIDCINMVSNAIAYYDKIGIYSPLLVFINLFGLTHSRIYTRSEFRGPKQILSNSVAIPPILIKSYDSKIANELKPAFDIIWQSWGYQKSKFYNNSGDRISSK